ncbi:hypothetical protein P40081_11600 [Paenibacillus sp. FSL P4-0081]|uniref:hypothetical protein n=1 Tax=Paenibacillus sp. FSL P4-0081 TaxID=1536769 RepID=UPI0004F6A1B2|nr:hypothetical protein [Paenibacillus sp. FSL P4-0081]AIQ28748.1 hypothetical protein P40081_11600 [Paenibacillus sp. FSL P4-0081]
MKNNEGIAFKITLSDRNGAVRGRPFRNIVIAAEDSLYALAEISIEAFDFDLDHAFGFYDNIKNALKMATSCLPISVRRRSSPA